MFTSVLTYPMRVKRKRGEREQDEYCLNQTRLTSVSVNVWGFCAFGFGVRVFRAGPNFNAAKYQQCLRENLVGQYPQLARRVLMQDNATFHVVPELKRFFRQNGMKVMKFPPQSSDLNIIENVWGLADRKLSNFLLRNRINREEDLFDKVKELCEEIPIEMVNKLYDSMPNRIAEVRTKRGKMTHY